MSKPAESSASNHPRESTFRWFSPISLTLTFSFFCLCLLAILFILQWNAKLEYLRTELEGTLRQIDESLATDRHFLQLLADRRSEGSLADEEFQSRSSQYLINHPFLSDIVQVERGIIIRQSVPPEAANRADLKLQPESEQAARRAQATGQPAYSSPYTGVQNQNVFAVYVPIVRNGTFLGAFGGIYSIDKFRTYFAAGLIHENLSLYLTAPRLHSPEKVEMKTGFALMSQTLPSNEIPEIQLTLTEPLGVRSLGTFFMLILVMVLVMILAGWLSHTSLRLAQELKQRQQVEAALSRSERLYRSIFDHAGLGIALTTVEGDILQTNPAFAKMLGYSYADLKGTNFQSFIHPDDCDSSVDAMQSLRNGEVNNFQLEKRYLSKSGKTVWAELTATCVSSDDGTPDYLIGMATDITDRRLAEQALASSEAKYRLISNQFQTLLNAIPDPLCMLDRDGSVSWHNKATEELFGVKEDFVQFCFKDFFDQLSAGSNIVQICFETGQVQEERSLFDGDKMVTLRTFPVNNENGEVIRVLLQIYDETEKLRHQETLLRTGQLAAVGELAAGVAHEINNPINGVINYAQILSSRLPQGDETHQFAEKIIYEGERVAAIASGLLAYTREKSGEKRPVALGKILSEVLLLAGTKMRNEGILVEQNIPATLPDIQVAPQQIQQVFLNLLSNARYALNARQKSADDKRLIISGAFCDTGMVRVTVRDNGIGIPDNLLSRVKEPFFTTKPDQTGTGLGLSICNDILSQHGSTLVIESREGDFTTATFELPCVG